MAKYQPKLMYKLVGYMVIQVHYNYHDCIPTAVILFVSYWAHSHDYWSLYNTQYSPLFAKVCSPFLLAAAMNHRSVGC